MAAECDVVCSPGCGKILTRQNVALTLCEDTHE